MTKKHFLAIALAIATLPNVSAQVVNHALQLSSQGYVDCGPLTTLSGKSSYTIQFWVKPEVWSNNAVICSAGNSFAATLGSAEGSLQFSAGGATLNATSSDLKAGQWSQISLVCDEGTATVYVNGTSAAQGALGTIADITESLKIGGNYTGLIDELRIWGIALPEDYDRFMFNTLNEWCPTWDDLLVYYKMDMTECPNLVDYKAISLTDAPAYNNHGIFSESGATRVAVDDNTRMPYLINSAYTANERFYDRSIPREQYLLSNDLIILGIQSLSTGHLNLCTPNNHATIEGGSYLAEYEGRTGVLSLDGTGKMTCPERTLEWDVKNGLPGDFNGYTFMTWLYLDEWTEGAYLIRKENADGTKGFSLRLGTKTDGTADGQLIARCNGNEYVSKTNLNTGEWVHVAISPGAATAVRSTFAWTINGSGKAATASISPANTTGTIDYTPSDDVKTLPTYIGENIKGKLDNTVIWGHKLDANAVKSQMQTLIMPGLGKTVDSTTLQRANACYLYDDPDNLGYSSYSQDEWKHIMESAYDGYKGYVVRISVKSHTNWQNTISDASRRKIFAADLATLSEGYDGVELDLEWMDGTQTNLGLLAQEIRAALPEGRTLFISCHAYGAYLFPKADMALVDGFTFQQYGPQKTYFNWSNFTSTTTNFINYGFPKNKIMTSYATTTSNGFLGSASVAVSGVRNGYMDTDDFVPQDEVDTGTDANGYTYYFTGPKQTYNRARYTMDNNLQGIFYWDMGNDVPVENKYNLAKWCSYGLCANVDRDIKSVSVNHSATSGITGVSAADAVAKVVVSPSPVQSTLNVSLTTGEAIAEVTVNSLSGATVLKTADVDGSIDASYLAPGIYLLTAKTEAGATLSTKFIKK